MERAENLFDKTYQIPRSESGLWAINYLVRKLRIPISSDVVEKVKYHPDYPSLLALSKSFSEWGIENLPVKLSILNLATIPLPAIAHLNCNGGRFVVLEKIVNQMVHYVDPEKGLIAELITEFGLKWSEAALLVSYTDGRTEAKPYRSGMGRVARLLSANWWTILALPLVLIPLIFLPVKTFELYLLNVLGSILSYALVLRQFGSQEGFLSFICKIGSGCDTVLHSRGSRILRKIYLSELCLLYFAGGVTTILISYSNSFATSIVFSLSIIALPVTVLSIVYQGFLGKWCPLCLGVVAVIWLEVFFLHEESVSFSIDALLMTIFGYCWPLLFGVAFGKKFRESFRVVRLEQLLEGFLKNDHVFQYLLDRQDPILIEPMKHEFRLGVADAPIKLTLVSSPTCVACVQAYAIVLQLLRRFEGRISVLFRFPVPELTEHSEELTAFKIVGRLLAISKNDQSMLNALSSWYQGGKDNVHQWALDNPAVDIDGGQVCEVILKTNEWCKSNRITILPTFLINSRRLPKEYSINDLAYQIDHLVKRVK